MLESPQLQAILGPNSSYDGSINDASYLAPNPYVEGTEDGGDDDGLAVWIIALIVVLTALVAIGCCCWFCFAAACRRKKDKKEKKKEEEEEGAKPAVSSVTIQIGANQV